MPVKIVLKHTFAALCFAGLLGFCYHAGQAATAGEIRTEIERLVIDTCVRTIARTSADRTPGISIEEMVRLIKIVNAKTYEQVYATLLPMVRGLNREQREEIYDFGLRQCLSGAKR